MFTRKFKASTRSFFLLGPRGTGKTTWLKAQYKSAVFYDLLDFSTYLKFLKDPSLFKKEVSALPPAQIIILDEVQKLPRLLNDVHFFLSKVNNKKKFILSGSSARKLRRFSANLLAGRASQKFFFPLTACECKYNISVEDILKYGTLPEVLNLKKPKEKIEFLESYVKTYLHEEIQQEAVAKNIESFSRFLDVSALCNGQLVNLSSLSRDSGAARTTLTNYFQILEDTLVGVWLKPWRKRVRIKETMSPKFFFFDTGIVRALSNNLRQDLSQPEKGFLLETYIFHELRFWNQTHDWGADIYFWKTYRHAEIDFILEIKGKRIGVEIKSSSVWKKEFGKYLSKAQEESFLDQSIGVYLGDKKLKIQDQIEVYPFFQFLKLLEKNKLFNL